MDVDRWLSEEESLYNAQFVADFFIPVGWTRQSISALCGNMRHESSINPNIWEYGYGHSEDRGYGLTQWTPMTKMKNWCISQGLDWTEGDSQLARIHFEQANEIQWFDNGYAPEFDNITFHEFTISTDSTDYLTKMFMAKYEHPNWEAGMNSLPDRQYFASLCLSTLDFGGGPTPPPTKGKTDLITLYLSGVLKW